MWGSKPFDFLVMGNGVNLMCEAKYWRKPPTEKWLRKEYHWLKDYAEKYKCKALVYNKMGRGKHNYMLYEL
jgi:hypothetical protein